MSAPRPDGAVTPRVRPELATALMDGELVIFDPVRPGVHQLGQVGAIVWQFLDGAATIAELVADLADAFGAPEERVRADVLTLLDELEALGLLAQGQAGTEPSPFPSSEPDAPTYLADPLAP